MRSRRRRDTRACAGWRGGRCVYGSGSGRAGGAVVEIPLSPCFNEQIGQVSSHATFVHIARIGHAMTCPLQCGSGTYRLLNTAPSAPCQKHPRSAVPLRPQSDRLQEGVQQPAYHTFGNLRLHFVVEGVTAGTLLVSGPFQGSRVTTSRPFRGPGTLSPGPGSQRPHARDASLRLPPIVTPRPRRALQPRRVWNL